MSSALHRAFDGLTVLVTGHTGFKGSWLSIWLRELGARVVGYSLDPPTEPSNFVLARLADRMSDERGDVRDLAHLTEVVRRHAPQVVFHLAAQPLVLPSYDDPVETFSTNVMGTVHLLEAVRADAPVRAVVCITTDKVYRNQEWPWGYREADVLGGHDPYAASKAMAELAIAAYRQSYFAQVPYERDAAPAANAPHTPRFAVPIASARAGNVIGGGDWSAHRLVPDCIRALEAGDPIQLRNPTHVRPWQLLLEPLSGYLWLAARMLGEEGVRYAEAWNFGPRETGISTEQVVRRIIDLWGSGTYQAISAETTAAHAPVETARLCLNWDKAAACLGWAPVYDWQQAIAATVGWYREYAAQHRRSQAGTSIDMYGTCVEQIAAYTRCARQQDQPWAH
jgi:CDP-glucose 4,6-dehydratase